MFVNKPKNPLFSKNTFVCTHRRVVRHVAWVALRHRAEHLPDTHERVSHLDVHVVYTAETIAKEKETETEPEYITQAQKVQQKSLTTNLLTFLQYAIIPKKLYDRIVKRQSIAMFVGLAVTKGVR